MSNRPPERHLAAWRSLLEAHAAVVELLSRELEEGRGLPLGWYDVLLTLDRSPEQRLRMQELAQSVLLSKSGLTRLIDRMEAKGLVRREPSPSDRRGAFAVLTSQGRSVFRRAAPVHLRGIQEHFARHLDDDEAATLFDTLSRVTAAARSARDARQPTAAESRDPSKGRPDGTAMAEPLSRAP
jgi:DNA-binding MarR family transcriptional regulator